MKGLVRQPELRRFAGFLFAGGLATVLNYAIFFGLYVAGTHYLLASATGYLSGIAVSYAVNIRVVFRDRTLNRSPLARYVIAYTVALFAQLAFLEILTVSGIPPEISNAVAIGVVVVLNFLVMRLWVFPAPGAANPGG